MVSELKNLLSKNKYEISEGKSGEYIDIYNAGVGCIEDKIRISKKYKSFLIYEIHRNEHKLIASVINSNEAVVCAAILVEMCLGSWNTNHGWEWVIKRIRTYTAPLNNGKVVKIISAHLNKMFFSVGTQEPSKISLIFHDGVADLIFYGEYIVNSVSLCDGFVSLYKYGCALKAITNYYNQIKRRMEKPPSLNAVQKIYIFQLLS